MRACGFCGKTDVRVLIVSRVSLFAAICGTCAKAAARKSR